ncbi:hypothetical protein ACEQ8H_007473 [Pleosporales sp. CAS-2024a]
MGSIDDAQLPPSPIDPRAMNKPPDLDERAKMDADRLWAEHTFNSTNLLATPRYLHEPTTSSYAARVAHHVLLKWHQALTLQYTRLAQRNQAAPLTDEYKILTRATAQLAQQADHCKTRIHLLQKREEHGPSTQQHATDKEARHMHMHMHMPMLLLGRAAKSSPKRAAVLKNPLQCREKLVNYGFSASTKIVPFKKSTHKAEMGQESAAADEEEEELQKGGGAVQAVKRHGMDGVETEAEEVMRSVE